MVSADFTVEMGQGGSVAVLLRLGEKTFPLSLSAERAAELGRALLAAGAVAGAEPRQIEPGTPIENCFFPVEEWWTGNSVADGAPMLVIAVARGTQLAFRFGSRAAEDCGAALARAGAQTEPA